MKIEELSKIGPTYNRISESIEKACNCLEEYDRHAKHEYVNYPHNYLDSWHQACYIARYLYAYAFEYLAMFSDLIEMGLDNDDIKVLSLGCGVMTDAWALDDILSKKRSSAKAQYVGIDTAPWNATFIPKTRGYVTTTTCRMPAQDYLKNLINPDFDILVFPKSIGDIGYIEDVQKVFEYLPKDTFFLAISRITFKSKTFDDSTPIRDLTNAISRAGFAVTNRKKWNGVNHSISSDWGGRTHPEIIKVHELTEKNPILWRDYEKYEVIKYKRK